MNNVQASVASTSSVVSMIIRSRGCAYFAILWARSVAHYPLDGNLYHPCLRHMLPRQTLLHTFNSFSRSRMSFTSASSSVTTPYS